LTASGGTSTLQTSNKSYKVHYSIGQQGPIGKIKSMMVNARQGFIQPPKFIEKNSIIDNLLKVKISPNPFTEALDIVFSEKIKNKIKIKVYDLMGRLVYDDELPEITEHKIYLNSIPDSQYILRLESEKKYFQTKIIKRK
tara:strand:- start:4369 stop:4788 length:420 start_codon:yes stop_codon:yes gene_type:complete